MGSLNRRDPRSQQGRPERDSPRVAFLAPYLSGSRSTCPSSSTASSSSTEEGPGCVSPGAHEAPNDPKQAGEGSEEAHDPCASLHSYLRKPPMMGPKTGPRNGAALNIALAFPRWEARNMSTIARPHSSGAMSRTRRQKKRRIISVQGFYLRTSAAGGEGRQRSVCPDEQRLAEKLNSLRKAAPTAAGRWRNPGRRDTPRMVTSLADVRPMRICIAPPVYAEDTRVTARVATATKPW